MFGVPYSRLDLALLPKYESEIPVVLTILDCYLRFNGGYEMEGIFRKNGKEQTFLDAMSKMDVGHSLYRIDCNCYIVGQLVKAFFREYQIIEPGFFHHKLLSSRKDFEIKNEFNNISQPLKSIMLWIIDVCIQITLPKYTKTNKMTIQSLAICFSPNFVRHKNASKLLLLQRSSQIIFKRLCELRENNELNNNNNDNQQRVHKWYNCSFSSGIYGVYMYSNNDNNKEEEEEEKELKEKEKEKDRELILKYIGDDDNNKLDLTLEEREKIENFGNLLSSRYNYENILYSELVRFVIGCKLRIGVAERRFLNLKKLETEYKLNEISLPQIRNELNKECYILCGDDLSCNAIIGFRINKFSYSSYTIAIIIKSLMVWIDSISSDINICRQGIVILFDMNGLTKESMKICVDLEKVFIKSFQDCYPMRIKQFIIVDAPIVIRAGIQFAKLILTKKLSQRIISVKSTPNIGSLWKYVDGSQVPACLGGTFSTPMTVWQYVSNKIINDIDMPPPPPPHIHDDDVKINININTKPNKGKKMFNKISSGMNKAKSGVKSGVNKAKKAKTKIKTKMHQRKAKKEQQRQLQQNNNNNNVDETTTNTKKTKTLSFNKRSETDYIKQKKEENLIGNIEDNDKANEDDTAQNENDVNKNEKTE